MEEAIAVGTGIVHNEEIDEMNIYEATKKAMITAVAQLSQQPDHLLIDAMKLRCTDSAIIYYKRRC